MSDSLRSASRSTSPARQGAVRPASFAGISGRAELRPTDLLALARDAFRRADYATAWLISDRLVRISGAADPLPLVLRASALARLGQAERSGKDLEQAAFADPFDRLANEAIIASGEPAAREKAFRRLIDAAVPPDGPALVGHLARLGKSALVRCEAADDGIILAGLAAAPTRLQITCRGEGRTFTTELAITEAARNGGAPFQGRLRLPWPDGENALALATEGLSAIVHPATVLRPLAEPPPTPMATAASGKRLLVVVPVHDDFDATRACFSALGASLPHTARIIAVDDRTPDPRIAGLLDALAHAGRITLIRNGVNLGFAASVNRALEQRLPDEDVALVNADTIVPPEALDRLHHILRREERIGTVTPLSNNGEDTSVPRRFRSSPLGSDAEVAGLNALAWRTHGEGTVVLPNGIGFCMLISARLLALRPRLPVAFGRGYFEDVAYCLDARAQGFDNVCATGVYVGHAGSRSFQDDKRPLVRRNLARLNQRFPDYRAETDRFVASDPLLPHVRRLEAAWLGQRRSQPVVLAAAAPDAGMTGLAAASLGVSPSALVFGRLTAMPDKETLQLAGGGGAWPQNLVLDLGASADAALAVQLLARASAVLVVDPHHLPAAAVGLVRKAGIRPAALMTRHAGGHGADRGWADRYGPRYVPTERLAGHFRKAGIGVSLVTEGRFAAPTRRPPLRADVLYLIGEPAQAPAASLVERFGVRLTAAATKAFTLAVLAEPNARRLTDHVAWVGAIADADLPGWLGLAGYGPVFFASRTAGISDPRVDLWAGAGIPVAFFDPDVGEIKNQDRQLSLPHGMTDEAAADAVMSWMMQLIPTARATDTSRR